jgi:hypothetical protein
MLFSNLQSIDLKSKFRSKSTENFRFGGINKKEKNYGFLQNPLTKKNECEKLKK